MKYFVEPKTAEANEYISAYLASRGLAEDSWSAGQEDTSGVRRDVWVIPDLRTMKLIRSVERQDSRVVCDYWKREETGGARLESARFLVITAPTMKNRRTAAFKRAVASLPKTRMI